jgi:hypothetical protein
MDYTTIEQDFRGIGYPVEFLQSVIELISIIVAKRLYPGFNFLYKNQRRVRDEAGALKFSPA